ncbi:hypothetical protein ACTXT7_014430 [Hymenolepis weldensis]
MIESTDRFYQKFSFVQLRSELINKGLKEPQLQSRNTIEPELPKTNSDDSSPTIIAPEREFDTEQLRERSQELLFIYGDSSSN